MTDSERKIINTMDYSVRPEDVCRKHIAEVRTLIESTYASYQQKPTWSKLQGLFKLVFEMGYEYGRMSIFESRSMKK